MLDIKQVKTLLISSLLFIAPAVTLAENKNPLRLVLPATIDAAPGIETNIYFDNVVLTTNPANYAFDVICNRGRQQQERWTFLPTPQDAGEHSLVLEIRDQQNTLVGRAESIVRVSAANAGQGKQFSVLLIGDSLTNASAYSQRLLDLANQPENPQIALIGSHGPGGVPGENRHEGYGGWTAERFATHFTGVAREGDTRKRGSPFLYETTDKARKLDFARYCQDVNGGKFPEYATIFLGPNDIFRATDETIESTIDTMLKHYDELIAMIHAASPTTVVGAMLPVPPAASQDAFGANYATGQTRWQYKRNQHRLIERMMQRYGSGQVESVQIVPTHLNLDCERNYPAEAVLPNPHAKEKIVRQNNGVHPSGAGYQQIGDSLFAWLKAHAAKSD